MSKIDMNKTVAELTAQEPQLKEYLISLGMIKLADPLMLKTMGAKVSLRHVLQMRNIDEASFLEEFERRSAASEENDHYNKDAIQLDGLLPCPVKAPLEEYIARYAKENNISIQTHFQSANLGVDAVKGRLLTCMKEGDMDRLPDIVSSAGFDFFFSNQWFKEFAETGLYGTEQNEIAEDFIRRGANIKDPKNYFNVVSCVPAVFIVRRRDFPNGDYPRTWEEVLSPDFKGGFSVPKSDLDMFRALTLTIKAKWGYAALQRLALRSAQELHPAQMTRLKWQLEKPSVSIAPYFFATMLQNDELLTIWPEDGAILSPVFTVNRLGKPSIQPMLDAFNTTEIAQIISAGGKFPSTKTGVDNHLSVDKKFIWLGWDFIYGSDIDKEVEDCKRAFDI